MSSMCRIYLSADPSGCILCRILSAYADEKTEEDLGSSYPMNGRNMCSKSSIYLSADPSDCTLCNSLSADAGGRKAACPDSSFPTNGLRISNRKHNPFYMFQYMLWPRTPLSCKFYNIYAPCRARGMLQNQPTSSTYGFRTCSSRLSCHKCLFHTRRHINGWPGRKTGRNNTPSYARHR